MTQRLLHGPASVIRLDHLRVPGQLDAMEQSDAARRVQTLLSIDPRGSKAGGTGVITKVANCVGEVMCLKSLRTDHGLHESAQERKHFFEVRTVALENEYRCQTSLLDIPGVPQTYAFGYFEGGPVMLMEWVRGVPLHELVSGSIYAGSLSSQTCAFIGASVTGILLAARQRNPGFVHRDLSGLNIMLRTRRANVLRQLATYDFDVVLIDFGSAASSFDLPPRSGIVYDAHYATPEYGPPEMLVPSEEALTLRQSERIDVYELCGVLYELYARHTPYRIGETRPSSVAEHKMRHRPFQIHELKKNADRHLIELVMQGLAAHQDQRPTLQELDDALVDICRSFDKDATQRMLKRREA